MNPRTKCLISIGALAVMISAMAFPAGASHEGGGGLTQTVSAALNLPAIPNPGAEVCTGADSEGNPTNCTAVPIGADARTLSLGLTYTLVNASRLPSVDAIAGSEAVPCPGTTAKKTGIALIAAGANFKSGSHGSLSVNGTTVHQVDPSENTNFYDTQAIFVRFCNL